MKKELFPIDWKRADVLIQLALEEDLADRGDTTTLSVIPSELETDALFLAKEDLICAGLPIVERLFHALSTDLKVELLVEEGQFCPKGTIMAKQH